MDPAPARESLLAGLLAPRSAGCELTTSNLGFMAAARGAAIDILDNVITNPISFCQPMTIDTRSGGETMK